MGAIGKRASSQNSRKHGLSCAPVFESSIEYQALVELIAEEGFSAFACADIASSLLNYRRVMDAYHNTYTSPEPVDEFLRDANMRASNPIFKELLSPSGSEPQDVREMAAFFASMQRQERRKGGPVSRRTAGTHKLIRYQRNAIARLSRAVRQG
jgi:streptomycin 6-kinase